MFIHRPDPIHPVRVDTPEPVFAEKLLEQFGGATGELSAAPVAPPNCSSSFSANTGSGVSTRTGWIGSGR